MEVTDWLTSVFDSAYSPVGQPPLCGTLMTAFWLQKPLPP